MASLENRLVWFELEVCPQRFRFAVMPGQPVLFGCEPDEGEEGKTILVPYEGNEELVDSVIESLDGLVRSNQIFSTPPNAPDRAFQEDSMKTASVHIRIAYESNQRWASMYALQDAPPNVLKLLEQSKQLGLEVFSTVPSRTISGERAMELVHPDRQGEARTPAAVIAKVKVTLSGQVHLNGALVSLDELTEALNRLRDEGGEVWYHRELPEQEPPPEVSRIVESVLNRIIELGLPIKLSETDFE